MKRSVMALVGKKHEALRTIALPVDVTSDTDLNRTALLAERMLATCRVKGGIAIAAPQVGVSRRVVVSWDGHVWINPRIEVDTDDTAEDLEGCLSLPGRIYRVTRPSVVSLTAADTSGHETTVDLDGLEARMIQHEVDHLDGILISTIGVEVANVGPTAMRL